MADNHSPKVRSYNMSQIRSNDTKPEELTRKYLFAKGLRYRKNDKRLPGKPDIVLPKYKTVVFIHGCFWHCHNDCPGFVLPKSNQDYWIPKLERNSRRYAEHIALLEAAGWRVIVVWECELKKATREEILGRLYDDIIGVGVALTDHPQTPDSILASKAAVYTRRRN
jgi:DNA mismatch endonuclease (patch repair protein)